MSRRRLLFVCQTLPYPPDGGVNIRSYHILRILAERFEVRALCFFRRAERRTADAVRAGLEGLGRLAPVEAFPIPQEHDRGRLLLDHARSLLRRRPYTLYAYESAAFRRRLRELLAAERFDLVHLDSLDLAGYVRDLPRAAAVACTHHNVESELLARRARGERGWARRAYLAFQARRVRELERSGCPRFALNVTVSDRDAERLRALAPGARFATVPNGVDTAYFRPGPDADDGIVFVGGTNWFPNRDALGFFATEVLPRLRRRRPDVTTTWVGRSSPGEAERVRAEHGIELTGYVDDVRPYVHRAACYVVPIRVGGGTRLKILDAWAMGKAIVSTRVGCEGLAARDGENLLLADGPEEFAEAIARVLADPALRRRLGAGGRATAVERYGWDVIARRIADLYGTLGDAA